MARPRRLTRAEKQAATRRDVLAAAAGVFAERGFAGATLAEIADRAGYSHGAVYSNFVGKDDLFLAVIEEYMATRTEEIAAVQATARGSFARRARALADQWTQRFAGDRESFLLQLEF